MSSAGRISFLRGARKGSELILALALCGSWPCVALTPAVSRWPWIWRPAFKLSIIFQRLGIDTLELLAPARTKWNLLPFAPSLVGGHCMGVDPYYLTHRAQEVGYHPEMILAGCRINDRMGTM